MKDINIPSKTQSNSNQHEHEPPRRVQNSQNTKNSTRQAQQQRTREEDGRILLKKQFENVFCILNSNFFFLDYTKNFSILMSNFKFRDENFLIFIHCTKVK